ncbi:MAG: C10 family peptidase [Bacteroidetes bacterium]|nr:C10 family peptidase [Bacteroidota bacterium]
MKKQILFLAVFFAAFSSFAIHVPAEKARAVAVGFYSHSFLNGNGQPLISDVRETRYNDITTFYTFNFDPAGFVIVAADDASIPILGYSGESKIPAEITNPALKDWLDGYSHEIYQIITGGLSNKETVQKWNLMVAGNFQSPSKDVSPLLSTTWDQGCFYNALCPADVAPGACGHTYTGCVATAMAQIMKYHNFPPQGVGSHTYTDPTYGSQTANFGSTTYNWASMPNNVSSANAAVATLMYHAGVSVNMHYSTSGSGAYSEDVPYAFMNYFNYMPGCAIYYKNSYANVEDFKNLIRTDLDQQLPVYYSGSNPSEGHAFVCDGYRMSDGTFHFNWGWSGSSNGWYSIGSLNPGGYQFNDNNAVVVQIKPYNPDLIVRITHPVNNAVIGVGYTAQIVASTVRGNFTLMKLFIDNVEKASVTHDSIVYTWNTSAPDLGSHEVKAVSYSATDTVFSVINLNVAEWISQASGFTTIRAINYMSAADSNVVWASAFDPTNPTGACSDFVHTVDGGTTWIPGVIGNTTGLASAMIFGMSATKAYDLMYKVSGSKPMGVYVTTDGGTTWAKQTTALFTNTSSFPDCIHFFNENEGWVVGDPINNEFEMYTTTDGGTNWTAVSGSNIPNPVSGEFGVVGYYSAVQDTLWFGTNMGRVYRSTDKGHTWTVATVTPLNGKYLKPTFRSGTHGLVQDKGQGTTGTFCESFDGGTTWTLVTPTGPVYATDLSYVPGTGNVWVSSGSGGTNGCSYSFNGGHFWNDFVGTQGAKYMQMTWLNNHCGWAGGTNTSTTEDGIYKYIGVLSIPLPPPVNLQASSLDKQVTLTWETPVYDTSLVTLQGYSVYRDNLKITDVLVAGLTFVDNLVSSGQYNYCVTAVYAEGESAKTCKNVEVVATGTSIADPSARIRVFPNPVNDWLHVRSADAIHELWLSDLSGREVFRSRPVADASEIPVASFNPGVYMLTTETTNGRFHFKVVVKH